MVSEMVALQKVLTRMAENVQKNTNKKKGDGTMGKRVAASNKALQKWLLELGNDMIIKLKFHIRLG